MKIKMIRGLGLTVCFASVAGFAVRASAQETVPQETAAPASAPGVAPSTKLEVPVQLAPPPAGVFDTRLVNRPTEPRAYFGPQLLSFILPGFDQLLEAQYPAMALYAGSAFAGMVLYANSGVTVEQSDVGSRDNRVRAANLGAQIFQSAGSLSAYASFRSAVRSQRASGKFKFLTAEEDVGDVMLAPFRFGELAKPTTLVPLAVLGALAVTSVNMDWKSNSFTGADVAYAGAFSYNAGTSEEALFRGWLMPVGQELMGPAWLANALQAIVFGSLHATAANPVPWPQTLLGAYLGYLTQRNGGSIAQGVFIHVWWDVIAFTATYMDKSTRSRAAIVLPLSLVF